MAEIKSDADFIPIAKPWLGEQELENLKECITTNWISSAGRFITEFESLFSSWCGMKYGIATTNGTAALHLALAALGIGKNDEVIIPDLTFTATANAVIYTGADIILCDVDKETCNIDPEKIEEKITERTKAIIPVHLYGNPCDMEKIRNIAKKHNLFVIEDCAEAHGAEFNGKKVGSFSDISCFSFYGNKIITTGEGGMCLTNNEKLAEKMRILRDHGMSREKRYWNEVIGFNYRMTNIQAAIGVAQMKKIDEMIRLRRDIAKKYNDAFSKIREINIPVEKQNTKMVFWMYAPLVENGNKRDSLVEYLKKRGVETRAFFFPIHEMHVYNKTNENYPVSSDLSKRGINLPCYPTMDDSEINKIINKVTEFYKRIDNI